MTARLHGRGRNPAEADGDRPLAELGHDLGKCRTRASRLWRAYQATDDKLDPIASAAAHQAWSDAVDDALRIAEAISRARPRDLGELLIQFEAIWWWLIEDDSVLDSSAQRWLRRFRRSLRQLAAKT